MSETGTIGYVADTSGSVAPMFCVECGEGVIRDVEPLTEGNLSNFDTASCALCEDTFYQDN